MHDAWALHTPIRLQSRLLRSFTVLKLQLYARQSYNVLDDVNKQLNRFTLMHTSDNNSQHVNNADACNVDRHVWQAFSRECSWTAVHKPRQQTNTNTLQVQMLIINSTESNHQHANNSWRGRSLLHAGSALQCQCTKQHTHTLHFNGHYSRWTRVSRLPP